MNVYSLIVVDKVTFSWLTSMWLTVNIICLPFRVESGKAGCFSPKVSKKEDPRKSLRKRFSLGKSSKDAVSVVAR